MCGCMGMGNMAGYVIAGLKPGQIIKIDQGFGFPAVTEPTTAIVWKVDGMSALTMSGISLNCSDGTGVSPTVDFNMEAKPTFKAQAVWLRVQIRNSWMEVTEVWYGLKSKTWLWKYRAGKAIQRWLAKIKTKA